MTKSYERRFNICVSVYVNDCMYVGRLNPTSKVLFHEHKCLSYAHIRNFSIFVVVFYHFFFCSSFSLNLMFKTYCKEKYLEVGEVSLPFSIFFLQMVVLCLLYYVMPYQHLAYFWRLTILPF